MNQIAIRAKRLFTPAEEIASGVILVDEGRIISVGRRDAVELPAGTREYNAQSCTVSPGFIDVHIHGAGGHDVMEAKPEALARIEQTIAR